MARTLRLLGRTDEWLAENDRCIELQPEYPLPYIDLAEYEASRNREEEAARNVRSYLNLGPLLGADPRWADFRRSLKLLSQPSR